MSHQDPRLSNLSPEKLSALFQKLKAKQPEPAAPQRIPRRDVTDGPAPLSLAQERLWILDQLQPGDPAYNVYGAVRLRGALDPDVLRHCLSAVVRRHESLRTTFAVPENAAPGDVLARQIVADVGSVEVDLPCCDLRAMDPKERPTMLRRALREAARQPFDLAMGPLLRTHLWRVAGTESRAEVDTESSTGASFEHVFLVVFHHIVADGWSAGLLINELAALYPSLAAGRERAEHERVGDELGAGDGSGPAPILQDLELVELPVQYPDYAVWQRRHLRGAMLERQLDFWRRQLEGLSDLELATDRPRPALLGSHGGRSLLRWGSRRTGALRRCAEDAGTTLFAVLLAGFTALLHRLSGQDAFAVGVPIAGRGRAELEGLIGFFVNTLVLRADVAGDPSFKILVERCGKRLVAAQDHQDLPFARLVEEHNPQRDLGRNPLVQVMLGLQNAPLEQRLGELGPRLDFLDVDAGTAALDLHLSLREVDNGLAGYLEYDLDLYDPSTAKRLVTQLESLLEAAAGVPETALSSLPLLPLAQRHQVLVEWNDTNLATAPATVDALFFERAEQMPDAVALVVGGEALSYAEVARRARHLAGHLRQLGVGPEVVVGVSLERSSELVTALLAVLAAGGAYLPLDPGYPVERLRFMLEDANAAVLIAGDAAAGQLASSSAVHVNPWRVGAPAQDDGPARRAAPGRLAYLIYTSGSTGRPKGVAVAHDTVLSFFAGMDRRLGLPTGRAWLAVTSISFDISVLELFWTLCRGARVVLHRDPPRAVGALLPAPTAFPISPSTASPSTASPSTASPSTASPVSVSAVSMKSGPQISEEGPRSIDFSLFYFASDEGLGEGSDSEAAAPGPERYRLLLEGARLGDRHGFSAVWTPERHFHAFGGLYPNPSVAGAAVAAVTERIGIRAGSVVLPLHNPARVAEEWALVDNLSNGRVGLSVASGWHSDDFVFAPDTFAERKEVMLRSIDVLRRLWRGETVAMPGGSGQTVEVRTLPRPVQAELPLWLTAAGNPETFRAAGELGAHVLTHLLGQTLDEVRGKIDLYHRAWREAGHPGSGRVTLMIHTFVGTDVESALRAVRGPFKSYLRHSVGLMRNLARSLGQDVEGLSDPRTLDLLLNRAVERYATTSALFGDAESCRQRVAEIAEIGVDEIGCLIDFGVPTDLALEGIERLAGVRAAAQERHPPRVPSQEDPSSTGLGGISLREAAVRHRARHLQCTPSQARLALDGGEGSVFADLDQLLLGGEALPAPLVAEIAARATAAGGEIEIHNMYGPTETTIWSATAKLSVAAAQAGTPVDAGRPIANTGLYVLDPRLRPLPSGAVGELWIGGSGVARGYHRRPGLSAARFVPDPMACEPGGRLYRSGDRALLLSGGRLRILGRADQQVKILGHRIEPGEIEAVLRQHAAVREVAVVALNPKDAGVVRLVACLVARQGAARLPADGLPAELRELCAERLPEWMVPSAFRLLDTLPSTANGKLDRAALARVIEDSGAAASRAVTTPYLAPRDALEEKVAALWRELLGVERLGVDDNFFEAGGNSLLLVQAQRRLASELGRELTLVEMFRHPTVRHLAAFLGRDAPMPTNSLDAVEERAARRKAARTRVGAAQVS